MIPGFEYVLTREQARAVDRLATEELGIPSIVLMENAARNAADAAERMLREKAGVGRMAVEAAEVLVCCGGGNNGGDGYAIARHLHNRGYPVRILTVTDPERLAGDAAVNHHIAERMSLSIQPFSVDDSGGSDACDLPALVVDAMLGTGFSGALREPAASAVRCVNALHARQTPVLAVDVPSGLDCQTGQCADPTVIADLTVTFVALKIGFHTDTARAVLGEVVVADIGTPPTLMDRARALHPAG